jgi:hypothetical protein
VVSRVPMVLGLRTGPLTQFGKVELLPSEGLELEGGADSDSVMERLRVVKGL